MHDPLAEERGWLREYVQERSQAAFAKLVGRYSDLVYSAAVRQTRGDRDLAEDVTQAVFLVLATRAVRIKPGVVLASWLLVVTRYAAGDALKAQARRQRRESKAAISATATTMNPAEQPMTDGAEQWQAIAPELDAALASLREKDRRAVVLRYLQGHSVEEVAAMLGASPAAAKQRIHRAVERLRSFFQARGVTGISAASIGPLLLGHAIGPAPQALVQSLLAASAKAGASAGIISIAKGAIITMAWTKAKTLVLGTGAVLLVAGGTAVAVGAFHRSPPHIVIVQNQLPTSTPTASNADAQRFEELYSLQPGQVAKFIPRPFIPERKKYMLSQRMPPMDQELMTFRWDGKPHWASATLGDESAEVPVEMCTGLDWYNLDDPQHVLQTKMPGDWVIRDGTPRENILEAIAQELSAKLGRDVHFERHQEVRDVIVVTGRFDPARIQQLPDGVLVVGSAPPGGARNFGPSHTRLRDVLNQYGQEVRVRVIVQVANADANVAWWNFDVKRANLDRDIASLASQTGLTFKKETRTMEIWTVLSGTPDGPKSNAPHPK